MACSGSLSSPRLAASGAGRNCEVISCRGSFLRFGGGAVALPFPFTLVVLVDTVFSGSLDDVLIRKLAVVVEPKALLP